MKNKMWIAIILVMLCVCVWVVCKEDTLSFRFLLCDEDAEVKESISSWESENGISYVFLPGYAELSCLQMDLETDTEVQIGDVLLSEGMLCTDLRINQVYDYTYYYGGRSHAGRISFVKSANIPAMYVDTQSGSMQYIHADKENREEASIRIYTDKGERYFAGTAETLGGRGNSTWEIYKKKAYSLILTEPADILNMGNARRWILLANASDASHMRNKIVYDFAKTIGMPYTPESEWVDLYLNGVYAGLYLLCERNEVHPERIDIAGDKSALISRDVESRLVARNRTYFTTNYAQTFRIHYPLPASESEVNELAQSVQTVENAILAEDGTDPESGKKWQELIDVESWGKKYLLEEIFGNMDAFYTSQYFYYDGNHQDDKLYAGPVWDYDLSMGNRSMWQLATPYVLMANRSAVREGEETPWLHTLYSDDTFWDSLNQTFSGQILAEIDAMLTFGLDEYAQTIAPAAEMNKIRWKEVPADIQSELSYIEGYLRTRIDFLKKIWMEKMPYHVIRADAQFGVNYGYFAVLDGTCLTDLPKLEDTDTEIFCGWYYSDSGEPFDENRKVTEDLEIYAKWSKKTTARITQIVKLMPCSIILAMGIVVLASDIRRSGRKNGNA